MGVHLHVIRSRDLLQHTLRVLADESRGDLDFVPQLQHTLQNGPSSDPADELISTLSRLVDVEGADDDHVGRRGVVADGEGNRLHDVLAHHIDVVLQLRGDGDDRRS